MRASAGQRSKKGMLYSMTTYFCKRLYEHMKTKDIGRATCPSIYMEKAQQYPDCRLIATDPITKEYFSIMTPYQQQKKKLHAIDYKRHFAKYRKYIYG